MLDLYACRFHAPEKVCKVLGALRQGRVNGKADLFFLRELLIFAQPLTVVQIPPLAVELGICNHG